MLSSPFFGGEGSTKNPIPQRARSDGTLAADSLSTACYPLTGAPSSGLTLSFVAGEALLLQCRDALRLGIGYFICATARQGGRGTSGRAGPSLAVARTERE